MSNLIENHVADVAVTMVFGLGYYLFKVIKNKRDKLSSLLNNKNDKFESSVKGKLVGALERWQYAKTAEEYQELIVSNNEEMKINDPFTIINMMNKKGIFPTIETYNALLLNCFNKNNFEQAEILKEEILDSLGPVSPDVHTLNVLIKGLGVKYKNCNNNSNVFDNERQVFFSQFDNELMSIIELLENRNIFMDLEAQNNILDILKDQGRLYEAWNHFINMKKFFSPDLFTYSSLLSGIKQTQEISCEEWLDKALEVFNEARTKSHMSEDLFNLIIEVCIKFNQMDKAEELFILSKSKNAETYNIMITGFGRYFKLEKSSEIFDQLKTLLNENLPMSSYEAMLTACARCKNLNLAESLVAEMTQKKISKSLIIYIKMINGYRRTRNYSKAFELYDYLIDKVKMQDESVKNIKLNTVFFNSILDCCVDGNKYDKMNQISSFIQEKSAEDKEFPQLDLISYSIIMKGHAKSNNMHKVTELYSSLTSKTNFKLDDVLYNTILDCYARYNDEQNVLKVYSDMKMNKMKTGIITYGVLIKLYCNLGNCNRAFELFDECVRSNNKPSVVIYQMLIKLQVKSKFIDRAITMFRNMLINNVKPDQQVYELIIKSCIEQIRYKEAAEFVLDAASDGIKLEKYIYQNLYDVVVENDDFKHFEKIDIFQQMVQLAANNIESTLKEKLINFTNTPIVNNRLPGGVNESVVRKVEDIFICEKSLYEEVGNNLNNYNKRNFKVKNNFPHFGVSSNGLNKTNSNNKKNNAKNQTVKKSMNFEEKSIYA